MDSDDRPPTSLTGAQRDEATRRAALAGRRSPRRLWVQLSHPFITPARLCQILSPTAGEQILKVGAGTGYYAFAVAECLLPEGRLEILDHDREILDRTMSGARARGISCVDITLGDACSLPYPDERFDGAYIITTLGELRDQVAALRELRRVLKPSGRLVVGDFLGDPHVVTFRRLCSRAEEAGLRFEQRLGGPLGYFARFTPEPAA